MRNYLLTSFHSWKPIVLFLPSLRLLFLSQQSAPICIYFLRAPLRWVLLHISMCPPAFLSFLTSRSDFLLPLNFQALYLYTKVFPLKVQEMMNRLHLLPNFFLALLFLSLSLPHLAFLLPRYLPFSYCPG